MGVAFVRNRQLAEVRLTEDLRAEIGNKPSSCIAHAFSGSCLLSSEAKTDPIRFEAFATVQPFSRGLRAGSDYLSKKRHLL